MWSLSLLCLVLVEPLPAPLPTSLSTPVPVPQAPSTDQPWATERLSNGVTVHVLQAPKAPKQTTFTFLPLGLDGDPGGRAQFAHLAEHMLIRSTDPTALRVDGIALNGETTGQVMRLESLAEPAHWEAALRRHARWLSVREFDAKVLEREKIRIEGEERATVPRGFNHKWATAAWAQIMAGRDHAAIHGDVAAATIEQVTAHVRRYVRVSRARIFAIGPRSAAEQLAVLKKEFESAAEASSAPPPPAPTAAKADQAAETTKRLPPGDYQRTWDLAARHYLEWYELPQRCTRLEAQVLAQVVAAACYQVQSLRRIPGAGTASAVWSGGRGYLLLSVNLPNRLAVTKLQEATASAMRQAPRLLGAQVRGELLARQLLAKPDFEAQRQAIRQPRFKDLVESQFAMTIGYACARSGLPLGRLAQAYRELDGVRLAKVLAAAAVVARRTSVVLGQK